MFVRQKKNKSGVVSVQVISKSTGAYKVAKTIGSSSDKLVISKLVIDGENWIQKQQGVQFLDFDRKDDLFDEFLSSIQQIKVSGTALILGKIFDEIGFNIIKDELFKKLVLARICYPVSKLKTVDYLRRYEDYSTTEDLIYLYLDKLESEHKRIVQNISYKHTLKILGNTIQAVFYDVTTLYFEIEAEDDLRKNGFSKDGKHQQPQIVLGLLVSKGGYPLAYEIFKGNKYEGDTMMPILNLFKRKYKFKTITVVADAGLLSNKNIQALQKNNYKYILGARIKNEAIKTKEQILSTQLANGDSCIIEKGDKTKLIISYSDARARKDNYNRERGLKKLEKQIDTGKLTKANINNKGYNKYLKLSGKIEVKLDKSKVNEDKKWDGLKGYITNTELTKEDVIENYKHLWNIEKAFRISKNEIKIRPIYHYKSERIQAHICLSFVAYKLYKELERQLKEKKSSISVDKAIEIAKTIYSIKAVKPLSKKEFEKVLIINEEQRNLYQLFYT
jgi:transposase